MIDNNNTTIYRALMGQKSLQGRRTVSDAQHPQ